MHLRISCIPLLLVGSRIASSVGASNDSRLLRRKTDESTRSLTKQKQPTKFFLCSKGLTSTFCRIDHATCEIEPGTDKSMCRCIDGYGGRNCDEDMDECVQTPYPCAGGTDEGFFCVNYNPPERYKCGCRQGYEAVLPTATEQTMDPVPVEWRPIKCILTDKCLESPSVCHVNATCTSSPTTEEAVVCTCNDDLQGDGITTCTLPTTEPETLFSTNNNKNDACTSNEACETNLVNSMCVENFCTCKNGFYRSNGRGQCLNTVECSADDLNDCHRDANCEDTYGSYECKCKDGYQDWNSESPPGRDCAQINECLDPPLNDCNSETQVCLDRSPPKKWECIERTPAPTPLPNPIPTRFPTPFPTRFPTPFPTPVPGPFPDCLSTELFKTVGLCIACTFLKFTPANCETQTIGKLDNQLLTGSIPSQLGLLTNLQVLDVYNNKLTGYIPSELGLLTKLTYMDLDINALRGSIPLQIGELTNLEMLFLDHNDLRGKIPSELAKLINLQVLFLQRNALTGKIPLELAKLIELKGLMLNENALTGRIPSELGLLTKLTYLYLHYNQLTGSIPSQIKNLTYYVNFKLLDGNVGLTARR